MDDRLVNSFTQATSHASIVAVVMTGLIITGTILVMDFLACFVVVGGRHEYTPYIHGYSINLYIVLWTMVCNILFTLPLLFCIIYITACFNTRGILRRLCCNMACSLNPYISRFIAFALGQYVFDKIATLSANNVVSLMFPLMMATPILCFSSHVGYILLAWLTEPSKCTAIFILYYALIFYFFIAFNKFYSVHSRMKLSSTISKNEVKNVQCKVEGANDVNLEMVAVSANGDTEGLPQAAPPTAEEEMDIMRRTCFGRFVSRSNTQYINTQAFCLLLLYGYFVVGIAVIFILIFLLLPISSENLVTYILELIQLVVVLVSTQLAYQLLFGSSFSFESVVKKFKEVYVEKGGNEHLSAIVRQRHEELSDITGEFTAKLTDMMIQKQSCENPVSHE